MTLWTPSGEHPVRKEGPGGRPGAAPSGGPSGPSGPGGSGSGGGPGGAPDAGGPPRGREPDGAGVGPDGPESAEQVEELRRQLAEAPPEVVVANHCYGLFELAAVYLSQNPPLLPQAQLAIDALGCLVEGLGPRLGDVHPALQQALAQVRLAYVQMDSAEQARSSAGDPGNGAG